MKDEKIMSDFLVTVLMISCISLLVALGYWMGSSNEPETKIVEKSVYTEREKCNEKGGDFWASDHNLGLYNEKTFIVRCEVPAQSIEI